MLYDFHVFHTPGSSNVFFSFFKCCMIFMYSTHQVLPQQFSRVLPHHHPVLPATYLEKKKVNINQKIPSRPQKSPTYPQKKLFMSAKEPHTFTYEPYIYLRRHRVPPLFQKKKIHCTQERPRLSVAYVFLCV